MDAPGQKVWLLGTAHVSEHSVREVRTLAENLNPDAVFVELCPGRMRRLRESGEEPQSIMDIFRKVMSTEGPFTDKLLKAGLQAVQEAVGTVFGLKPGGEFLAAMDFADTRSLPLICGDRDVDVTAGKLRDALAKDWWSLMTSSEGEGIPEIMGHGTPAEVLERLRNRPTIRKIRQNLTLRAPNVANVLIAERDSYMFNQLASRKGTVLAVVGAGHMDGIEDRWLQRAE